MRWGANAKFAKKEKKEAYYLINLKGNQGKLRKDVERFFDDILKRNIGEDFVRKSKPLTLITDGLKRAVNDLLGIGWSGLDNWPGLKSIVKTKYTYEIRGESKTEIRFHISPSKLQLGHQLGLLMEWQRQS